MHSGPSLRVILLTLSKLLTKSGLIIFCLINICIRHGQPSAEAKVERIQCNLIVFEGKLELLHINLKVGIGSNVRVEMQGHMEECVILAIHSFGVLDVERTRSQQATRNAPPFLVVGLVITYRQPGANLLPDRSGEQFST